MTDVHQLIGRELDAAVQAEVFGHTHTWKRVSYHGNQGSWWRCDPCSSEVLSKDEPEPPQYSLLPMFSWAVEERIATLHLQRAYMAALWRITEPPPAWDGDDGWNWAYCHATPRQRCEAALAATRAARSRDTGEGEAP